MCNPICPEVQELKQALEIADKELSHYKGLVKNYRNLGRIRAGNYTGYSQFGIIVKFENDEATVEYNGKQFAISQSDVITLANLNGLFDQTKE